DGSRILFLLEDDRARVLASLSTEGGTPQTVTGGRREINWYETGPSGKVSLLASDNLTLPEAYALENGQTRPLTNQNEGLLSKLNLGKVEEITFKSKDGTTVNGFIVKPPEFVSGQKYPTLLRIHGGPVSQFGNSFSFEWQLFAAHGYVVVAANPRGSSGRG